MCACACVGSSGMCEFIDGNVGDLIVVSVIMLVVLLGLIVVMIYHLPCSRCEIKQLIIVCVTL